MVPITSALYVLGAWIFWGTYPVPFKLPAAQKANTDPFAFQFMKSIMVCATSWIILAWKPLVFTYWGLVGAALWIPSGLLFISAVKLMGIAFAAPISSGVQVIVSFCWGAFYFKEEVHSPLLSVLGLFVMILGMIGISVSVNFDKIVASKESAPILSINVAEEQRETSPLMGRKIYQPLPEEVMPQRRYKVVEDNIYGTVEPEKPPTDAEKKLKLILGIVCAITGGITGGTQNVPLKHAPPEAHGIQYVISFGIGAVAVIAVFTLVYVVIRLFMKKGLPTVNLKLSAGPGFLAGLLWSAGNICNIYATLEYGTTVGFPLVCCNMMVAGMWGVFFYNEAPKLWLKFLFIFSCATLLGGVTLLTFYG